MAALLTSLGISIHAPREGGDSVLFALTFKLIHFNPRPPRGGRQYLKKGWTVYSTISIHAPREGGDKVSRLFDKLR